MLKGKAEAHFGIALCSVLDFSVWFVDRLSASRSTLVRKNADKRCALSAFSLYPVDDGAAVPNPARIENGGRYMFKLALMAPTAARRNQAPPKAARRIIGRRCEGPATARRNQAPPKAARRMTARRNQVLPKARGCTLGPSCATFLGWPRSGQTNARVKGHCPLPGRGRGALVLVLGYGVKPW
jgi:hypothetical protein